MEHSDLGIKQGSPALQADSLPTELSGKPYNKKTLTEKQQNPCVLDTNSRLLEYEALPYQYFSLVKQAAMCFSYFNDEKMDICIT